jgi:hypothetical protein
MIHMIYTVDLKIMEWYGFGLYILTTTMAGLGQQPHQRFITLAVWEELPSLVVFGFMLD